MPDEPAVSEEQLEKGRHESWERTINVHDDDEYFFRPAEMDEFSLSDYTSGVGCAVESDRIQILYNTKEAGTGATPHEHPNEQFNYVLEGTLRVIVDGEEELAPAGTLFYIPADATHQTVATEDADVTYLEIKDGSYGISGYAVDEDGGAHHDPNEESAESS